MTSKSCFRFERINKLYRFFFVLAIFSFVYPLKYHVVTLLLSHQSESASKDDGYRSEITNEVCFCAVEIKPSLTNCRYGS